MKGYEDFPKQKNLPVLQFSSSFILKHEESKELNDHNYRQDL